ncbi:RNA-directed DNA polymerase [Luteolibacter ambystomatis]|uniref:RNA-directed DNA polymerase n=1 Tax=Luteolibacter ambystomatis TaxID=2824561 RepID=A0A975IYC3_9BACT|nr:reverse transcriptase family protein [Luteolibacter ambystomatis]QUE50087.1 RNA-directed DNA polymerase [Luteolibacter ambystomatis]
MNAPPLLVSFDSLHRLFLACGVEDNSSAASSLSALVEIGFPPIVSKATLGVLFGYSPRFIGAMCKNPDRYYRTFYLPKGNGKFRRIDAPRVALKVIQKWAGFHLANNLKLSPSVVGFIPKISAIDGAARHCSQDWVFSTDIENFFQTTAQSRVTQSLIKFGFPAEGAELFSKLSCLNGNLAQGAPCSPVLSNICFSEFDVLIENYSLDNELVYTRYADDIVISGRGNPPPDLENKILEIVTAAGWSISSSKTRFSRRPNRLKVYGLLVSGDVPRLTKGYRNRIRALRHLENSGKLSPESEDVALGHLSYAKSVERFGLGS